MIKDKFGQQIYQENEVLDMIMSDIDFTEYNLLVDSTTYKKNRNLSLVEYIEKNQTIDEFDKLNQDNWYMPQEYKEMDIASYVLGLCKSDAELQRCGKELLMYQDRKLFELLKYLKYLVDVMNENNIIWGIGRGSSVSSYVLYLIGIHKVDSLYYDLNIEEFLR